MIVLHLAQHAVHAAQNLTAMHVGAVHVDVPHMLSLVQAGFVPPQEALNSLAGCPTDPMGDDLSKLKNLIDKIKVAVWAIGGTVFIISLVIGAIMRMTSYGNERRVAMSNMALTAAVVGLAIMLLSSTINQFLVNTLNGGTNPVPGC